LHVLYVFDFTIQGYNVGSCLLYQVCERFWLVISGIPTPSVAFELRVTLGRHKNSNQHILKSSGIAGANSWKLCAYKWPIVIKSANFRRINRNIQKMQDPNPNTEEFLSALLGSEVPTLRSSSPEEEGRPAHTLS
jgi:hypothetical protein